MKTSMTEQMVRFFEHARGMHKQDTRDEVPGYTEECEIDGVRYIVMADNRGECLASLTTEEHNYVS